MTNNPPLQGVKVRDLNQLLPGPVCTQHLEETLQHPHFREREMVHETTHPQLGAVTHLGFPVKMSDFRFSVSRQAPAAGEHTVEVLRELAYSEEMIFSLRETRAAF
jgi:formyl-CoA transferase